MQTTRGLLMSVFLLVLSSSVRGQDGDDAPAGANGPNPGAGAVCFDHRRPRSVTPIDDLFVYVQARGADNHYLLQMDGCVGLRGVVRFSFERTRSSRICPGDSAQLVYQPSNGGPTARCVIRDVVAVGSFDEAESLAATLLGRGSGD